MAEMIVTVDSVELCVETFGDSADPLLLLLAGTGGSMDTWHPDFCTALADAGRFVLRFDYRDTGRSVSYPPGKPDYTFFDLMADAVGLIDRFGGGRADLAGLSMGGGMAQMLAVDFPDKVASLTLIATSPIFPADLPPLTPALVDAYAAGTEPDWNDDEAVVEHLVRSARIHEGSAFFDESEARVHARRLLDRTPDLRTTGNHGAMRQESRPERDFRALVSRIGVPTLVVHGTADPMFPQEHGVALAEAIPGARLLLLDGMGHQAPPRPTWDRVIAALPSTTR